MLDLQVEHHLFPTLSYAEQWKIKPFVEQTARDFGLPYYEYSSVFHGQAASIFHQHKLAWPVKAVRLSD